MIKRANTTNCPQAFESYLAGDGIKSLDKLAFISHGRAFIYLR